MKKLLLIPIFFLGLPLSSQAQSMKGVDVQINPIAILFGGLQLTAEFPVSRYAGLEVDIIAGEGNFGLVGIGKYYFNPEFGADRFYIGAFAGALSEAGAGGGFITGYKWLSSQGVSFELNLGIGRGSGDLEVFPYFKSTVGYRFGKKD